MDYTITKATQIHLKEISHIYNDAIENTTSIFHWDTKNKEEMQNWFDSHIEKYPIFVAISQNEVIGWSAISPSFPSIKGYLYTVEDSIYIKEDFQGKGLGKKMLSHLCKEAKRLGYHSIISKIVSENEKSILLHKKEGFEISGILKEVGYKFNSFLDVVIMQKIL